jgi:Ca-activated chloride channel family protein
MIHFSYPWVLLGWLSVPWLLGRALRGPRGAIRYADLTLLAPPSWGREFWAKWGGISLRAACLLLLVAAAAGPRWPDPRTRIPTEGVAIQIALDVSGSMAETDFLWNGVPISRLEAAKNLLQLLVAGGEAPGGRRLEGRAHDLMGLVTFARWPETACPLTLSHAVLLGILADQTAVHPHHLPGEAETNLGDAMAWGIRGLDAAGSVRKVMVLFTDGEHNVPSPALTPRQAAQLAAHNSIPIYVVDVGNEAPADQETSERQVTRHQVLQAVAALSGGKYWQAHNTHSLVDVCSEIDRLERQEITSFTYLRYFEVYPWAGMAALACWGLLLGLDATVWRRLP